MIGTNFVCESTRPTWSGPSNDPDTQGIEPGKALGLQKELGYTWSAKDRRKEK